MLLTLNYSELAAGERRRIIWIEAVLGSTEGYGGSSRSQQSGSAELIVRIVRVAQCVSGMGAAERCPYRRQRQHAGSVGSALSRSLYWQAPSPSRIWF